MLTMLGKFFNSWQSTLIIGLVVAGGGYWLHRINLVKAVENATLGERIKVVEELGVADLEEAKRKIDSLETASEEAEGLRTEIEERDNELEKMREQIASRLNSGLNRLTNEIRRRHEEDASVPNDQLNSTIRGALSELRRKQQPVNSGGETGDSVPPSRD